MAVYTNRAAMLERIGADRLLMLLDRDGDGSEDTGVLDAAIERAGRIIRTRLRQRYGSNVDTIADIDDATPTPGAVQEVAEDLVLFDLYSYIEPGGRDAEYHRETSNDRLAALQAGDEDFEIGRASAAEGQVHASYTASTPKFAGVDAYDVDRTRGI